MSKKETVKELREKLTRISKAQGNLAFNLTSCRLWKLDPHIDWRQFIQRAIEEKEEVYPIKGTRLTEGQVLEVFFLSEEFSSDPFKRILN